MHPAQALLSHRKVLLLQGPMGNFFNKLSHWLQAHGVEVFKVNLNGGDWLFHRGTNTMDYRGNLSDFPAWLAETIHSKEIESVICFGDCRAYHRLAQQVVRQCNKTFYVFEEGYLRPDYITLEQGGVNAYSILARKPLNFLQHEPIVNVQPHATMPSFRRMGLIAMIYYAAGWFLRRRFPHYQHHKDFSPFRECFYWCLSGIRKIAYQFEEKNLQEKIINKLGHQYFLVALQVFNDSQVIEHSPYSNMQEFIEEVITSFALHADASQHLVIKHHPMDRGHKNYKKLIASLAKSHGAAQRIHYIHDGHLPTLLKCSVGVVTINSTVGLSALHHGKPLIATGRAFYDIEGLTCQQGLEQFWKNPPATDHVIYQKLRSYMLKTTQPNGAFFGKSPWLQLPDPRPVVLARLRSYYSALLIAGTSSLILLVSAGEEVVEECLSWGPWIFNWLLNYY